jgi:hypothetical protein
MLILSALVLVAATTAPSAFAAEDCSTRNLYEIPSNPIHEIPIADQGETALCYAYTVGQLTEAYLRESGQWKLDGHIDPLWAALTYKSGTSTGIRIRPNTLGNGLFKTAFHDLEKAGICDPSVASQAIERYKNGSLLEDADFFQVFELLWDLRAEKPEYFEGSAIDFSAIFSSLASEYRFKGIAERLGKRPEFDRDIRALISQIAGIRSEVFKSSLKISYLRSVVLKDCSGDALLHFKLPKPESRGLTFETNASLKRGIDRMLDTASPLPVGIGYCAGIYSRNAKYFENASRRGALLPRFTKALRYTCGAHYSTVVGRRKNEYGKCQYLVRNTYGRDFWTKRYECLCKNGNRFEACKYDEEHSPKSDSVVGCWFDEEPLLNSLYDVSTLTDEEIKSLTQNGS